MPVRQPLRLVAVAQAVLLAGALGWGSVDAVTNSDERRPRHAADDGVDDEDRAARDDNARVLDRVLIPACGGTAVPQAAERGPMGTPRRAWFIDQSEPGLTSATTGDVTLYDTVVCSTTTPGAGTACTMTASGGATVQVTHYPAIAHVSVRDARSGLEIGTRDVVFDEGCPSNVYLDPGEAPEVHDDVFWAGVEPAIQDLLAV